MWPHPVRSSSLLRNSVGADRPEQLGLGAIRSARGDGQPGEPCRGGRLSAGARGGASVELAAHAVSDSGRVIAPAPAGGVTPPTPGSVEMSPEKAAPDEYSDSVVTPDRQDGEVPAVVSLSVSYLRTSIVGRLSEVLSDRALTHHIGFRFRRFLMTFSTTCWAGG